MKIITIPFIVVICLLFEHCSSEKQLFNYEKFYKKRCPNVSTISANELTFLKDKKSKIDFATDITLAAVADATKSDSLLSTHQEGNINVKGSLSQTTNKYYTFKRTVTQDFWQQQEAFANNICILQAMKDDPSLTQDQKNIVFNKIIEFTEANRKYSENVKKKGQQ